MSYPILGFAPGSYQCRCTTCEQLFIGDKRAVQCESCAIDELQELAKNLTQQNTELINLLKGVISELSCSSSACYFSGREMKGAKTNGPCMCIRDFETRQALRKFQTKYKPTTEDENEPT